MTQAERTAGETGERAGEGRPLDPPLTRTVLEDAVIGLMERRVGPPPPATDDTEKEREKENDIDLAAGEYEAE